MQVEQHRIASVSALDEHPLLDAVDVDADLLRDAVCERSATVVEIRFRRPRTQQQWYADKNENRHKHDSDGSQRHAFVILSA